MHIYILTSAIINAIGIAGTIAMMGLHIKPKPETDGWRAFRVITALGFLGWACYLLIQGA